MGKFMDGAKDRVQFTIMFLGSKQMSVTIYFSYAQN
jgi:hypothetical protein